MIQLIKKSKVLFIIKEIVHNYLISICIFLVYIVIMISIVKYSLNRKRTKMNKDIQPTMASQVIIENIELETNEIIEKNPSQTISIDAIEHSDNFLDVKPVVKSEVTIEIEKPIEKINPSENEIKSFEVINKKYIDSQLQNSEVVLNKKIYSTNLMKISQHGNFTLNFLQLV